MRTVTNPQTWNRLVAQLPNPHLLQTWQWGQFKARYGWQPAYYLWGDQNDPQAAALVLLRAIRLGGFSARLGVMYAPKGPLLADWADPGLRRRVLDDLQALARRQGAMFLKLDPDVPLGRGLPGTPEQQPAPVGQAVVNDLRQRGYQYSAEQIQFRNTVLIDLQPDEDTLLANMKQKTRYNVRLAGRRGVTVRPAGLVDLDLLYHMYAETALRDGFAIRNQAYYQDLWSTYVSAGLCEPLIAAVDDQPVAAVVIFRFAGTAYYLHGMSRELHRDKMPNYLLQWEAMRRAKAAGCQTYDLWGAPEVFDESDDMWGVYRFKEGLGGQVLRTLGAYDLPLRPFYYRLYTQTLPRLLDILRRRGNRQTQRSIQG